MKLFLKACWQWLVVIFGLFFMTYVAVADTLTVTIAGSGSGTVNSNPAGIACDKSASPCSATFANLTSITLTAFPDWKSLEGVLSVGCSGSGSCTFNINGDTGVTAKFSENLQATILGGHSGQFATLTAAYTDANDDSTIAAHPVSFDEDLILNRSVFVRLYGGRDGVEYLTLNGDTTLMRSLIVQAGYLVVDRMIVRDIEIYAGVLEIDSLKIQ